MTNTEVLIWTRPGQSLLNYVRKQQMTYFGHVIRAEGLEKMLMVGRTEERTTENEVDGRNKKDGTDEYGRNERPSL